MKHFFLSYKAITAALTISLAAITTSCSQDIDNNSTHVKDYKAESSKIVKLSFGPSTRGTMYDEISQMADNATFGVYGYARKDNDPICKDPNFINNGSAEKKDGIVRVGGKVATYKDNMPKVKIAAVYPKLEDNAFTRTGENTYTLTYALKEDMSTQQDLLIGEAPEFTITSENSKNDLIDGKQTVDMHHALTAINFAIGDRLPTGYTIEGIRLTGLYTKGTCKVDLSQTTDAKRFKWEDLSEKDKYVYIITNHITTTQINRTQFTGLKTGNKYDNLTIFMIPQQVGDDAKAEVVLKKDEKYGADGNIYHDSRLPLKLITIPLKLKDDKQPYKAGQVEKYNIGAKPPQEDLKPLLYFIKKDNSIVTSSTIFNLEKDADKKEITNEGTTKYGLTIFSARYVADKNDGNDGKTFTPLIVAPHTFRIVKITYDHYYKGKDKKGREKILREKDVKVPEGSVVVEDIKQPDSNDKNGHFTLTFNPKKYPDLPKGKKFDKIYIHIELDGAVMTLQQSVKGFPQ